MAPPTPFALSLSKGCFSYSKQKKGQGFDKLSPNGIFYG
jgi:hypothetical protein